MLKHWLLRAAIIIACLVAPRTALPQIELSLRVPPGPKTWHNSGSDLPVDPRWHFGTLPNGLRYAIRRGVNPPGAISIRVRMDVGALNESDQQQGWSHLIEHLAVRGTARFADGEAMKIWERLGASYGTDSNAMTSLTATVYKLDLPKNDAGSYGQAMAVLADTMDNAAFNIATLDAERRVVNAERELRMSPAQAAIRVAQQPLFYFGTKAAERDIIGPEATLAAATPATLQAYYDAWYRPSNAVVVVVGDADPAQLEQGIVTAFSGWRESGRSPPKPDLGMIETPVMRARAVTQAQLPEAFMLAFMQRPRKVPATQALRKDRNLETIAALILNDRLQRAATKGQAIVNASPRLGREPYASDQLLISVTPAAGQWKAALDQLFAVLNGAAAEHISVEEISTHLTTILGLFNSRANALPAQASADFANEMLARIDAGDIMTAPETDRTMLAIQVNSLTPAMVSAAIRDLIKPAPRLLVMSSKQIDGGDGAAASALASAQRVVGDQAAAVRAASLDELVLTGKPATVTGTNAIAAFGAERVSLSNGVELILRRTAFQKNVMDVAVQLDGGLVGQPREGAGPLWSIGALSAGGIGPFTPEEVERLSTGRQLGFSPDIGPTMVAWRGTTNGRDLPDMLKLMAGQVSQPRFSDAALNRLRQSATAGYQTLSSQPMAVLQLFGGPALYGGDPRFLAVPTPEAIAQLDLPSFQRFWTGILAHGPLRVIVVGDFDRDATIAAVSRTLGTLPALPSADVVAAADQVRAARPAAPVVLQHRGQPGQAFVGYAFPTLGLYEQPRESAALRLLASLIETRMVEVFRGEQGGSYAPTAVNMQSQHLSRYGLFLVGAQVETRRTKEFEAALDAVIADLSNNGPAADALDRVRATAVSGYERGIYNNGWWVALLGMPLTQQRVQGEAATFDILKTIGAAEIKAAAARYLVPASGFSIRVMPAIDPK